MKKVVVFTKENKAGKVTETDKELHNPDAAGIQITSMEQLEELAKMAGERMDGFQQEFQKLITKDMAHFVYGLRVTKEYSWRAVAQACYEAWEGTKYEWWYPSSNQLAGMAICEISAKLLGNDYMDAKWN